MAPFAEQDYDLVKHDFHFTLLSLCPQDWKLGTRKQEQNVIDLSLQTRVEDNIGSTAAPCYKAPTAQGPHDSTPALF